MVQKSCFGPELTEAEIHAFVDNTNPGNIMEFLRKQLFYPVLLDIWRVLHGRSWIRMLSSSAESISSLMRERYILTCENMFTARRSLTSERSEPVRDTFSSRRQTFVYPQATI